MPSKRSKKQNIQPGVAVTIAIIALHKMPPVPALSVKGFPLKPWTPCIAEPGSTATSACGNGQASSLPLHPPTPPSPWPLSVGPRLPEKPLSVTGYELPQIWCAQTPSQPTPTPLPWAPYLSLLTADLTEPQGPLLARGGLDPTFGADFLQERGHGNINTSAASSSAEG